MKVSIHTKDAIQIFSDHAKKDVQKMHHNPNVELNLREKTEFIQFRVLNKKSLHAYSMKFHLGGSLNRPHTKLESFYIGFLVTKSTISTISKGLWYAKSGYIGMLLKCCLLKHFIWINIHLFFIDFERCLVQNIINKIQNKENINGFEGKLHKIYNLNKNLLK